MFAQIQPRHAVIYHFFNDFDTAGEMERDVRKGWQGPLSLAQDLMVFNVTKDEILVRMAVTPDHVWPNKKEHQSFLSGSRKQRAADVALARRQAIVSEVLSLPRMTDRSTHAAIEENCGGLPRLRSALELN